MLHCRRGLARHSPPLHPKQYLSIVLTYNYLNSCFMLPQDTTGSPAGAVMMPSHGRDKAMGDSWTPSTLTSVMQR